MSFVIFNAFFAAFLKCLVIIINEEKQNVQNNTVGENYNGLELSKGCQCNRSFIAKAGFAARSRNKRLQLKLEESSGACWKQWKSLRPVTSNCPSLKNGTRLQSLYYVRLQLSHFLLLQRLLTTNLS